jgi:hypothetical protein
MAYPEHKRIVAAAAILLSGLIAGCGGGGGDEAGAAPVVAAQPPATEPQPGSEAPVVATGSTPETPVETSGLTPDCSGTNCSATSANTYAGSGVGMWKLANTSGAGMQVPVNIGGLSGQDVMLVLTNTGATDQPMPGIALSDVQRNRSQPLLRSVLEIQPEASAAKTRIAQFNSKGAGELLRQSAQRRDVLALAAMPRQAAAYTVGVTTRSWNHLNDSNVVEPRTARLEASTTMGDGTVVNFWVETSQIDGAKVSPAILAELVATYTSGPDAILGMVEQVAGKPWGPHGYSELIPAGQPIDIVVLDFTPDTQPYGLLGYFWGANNFTQAVIPDSNEAVALFLDAETLYLDAAGGTNKGLQVIKSTMAHETTHMVNFYQRGVLPGGGAFYLNDTWLEEMTAMVMEDLLSTRIDATYNKIRDVRLAAYLGSGNYNCKLTVFVAGNPCDGYSVSGSFGGYLLRQYGLAFYKHLLANKSSGDSETVLDASIKAAGGPGLAEALRRWSTTVALLPAGTSPAGFGYPGRTETGFTIIPIDGAIYSGIRKLPTVVPPTLKALASFPVLRPAVSGTYTETVTVPANTTLSVVIR